MSPWLVPDCLWDGVVWALYLSSLLAEGVQCFLKGASCLPSVWVRLLVVNQQLIPGGPSRM